MNKLSVLIWGLKKEWVATWSSRQDVRLVGAFDCDDTAQLLEAAKRLRPDLVAVATPPDRKTEPDVIASLVRAGCHVGLEKLRPTDANVGESLLRGSRDSGRSILIGESYRCSGRVECVKEALSYGLLGKVEEVVWRCHRPVVQADWMKAYRHVMLEDLSYHHLGVIHHLLGFECRTVYARSSAPAWSAERSPGIVSMIAESTQGVRLSYYASWAARGEPTSWLGEFRIEGSAGALICERERLVFVDAAGDERQLAPVEPYPDEYERGIVAEFVAAVRRPEPGTAPSSIGRFMPVVRWIYAAVASAESGRPVVVKECSE